MTTVKGVNRTLADTGGAAGRLKPGLYDGRVKMCFDSYEADALAIGSIIEMCKKLPKNAKVVDVILDTDALGNAAELIVGDYEDDNRYITATDHGSAALVTRMNAIAGRLYEMDESDDGATASDRQIIITTSVGEITGTIKAVILFVQD